MKLAIELKPSNSVCVLSCERAVLSSSAGPEGDLCVCVWSVWTAWGRLRGLCADSSIKTAPLLKAHPQIDSTLATH